MRRCCNATVTRNPYHVDIPACLNTYRAISMYQRTETVIVPPQFDALSAPRVATLRPTAELLIIRVPAITSDMTNAEVMDTFGEHRELVSLPVLERGKPIGLISRNIFMSQMSRPYYRELYEKKSCIAFMDKAPLIVEADTPIETLAARAVASGDKTLIDGFLIVQDGAFAGVGSGLDLMQVLVDLQTEKNRQVMQSIDYASTIQRAMLGESLSAMQTTLSDVDIVWEPRDIVGGDFYHFQPFDDGWFAAIADCTGHGVPGAFLTLIASSALRHALDQNGPRDPALLMGQVSQGIKQALGQHEPSENMLASNDGMDAVFFWFDTSSRTLTSAHAKMPLFILAPGQTSVQTLDGERTGLGYVDTPTDMVWKNHSTVLAPQTLVCCSTDGLTDQIGGPKNIAFGKRRLRQAILGYHPLPAAEITRLIRLELRTYQDQHSRRDDVTFLAFRVD